VLTLQVSTASLPNVSGGNGIGVAVETKDPNVVLPFGITFRPRPNIGGPSAGLAYSLAIADMLDPTDDAQSRAVAATGTVAADGSVGAVGGVHEKAIAVHDAGGQLFIVPSDEVSSVRDGQLTVHGVADVVGALRFLRG
jgi:PDZ domain-containing secreted protein